MYTTAPLNKCQWNKSLGADWKLHLIVFLETTKVEWLTDVGGRHAAFADVDEDEDVKGDGDDLKVKQRWRCYSASR